MQPFDDIVHIGILGKSVLTDSTKVLFPSLFVPKTRYLAFISFAKFAAISDGLSLKNTVNSA